MSDVAKASFPRLSRVLAMKDRVLRQNRVTRSQERAVWKRAIKNLSSIKRKLRERPRRSPRGSSSARPANLEATLIMTSRTPREKRRTTVQYDGLKEMRAFEERAQGIYQSAVDVFCSIQRVCGVNFDPERTARLEPNSSLPAAPPKIVTGTAVALHERPPPPKTPSKLMSESLRDPRVAEFRKRVRVREERRAQAAALAAWRKAVRIVGSVRVLQCAVRAAEAKKKAIRVTRHSFALRLVRVHAVQRCFAKLRDAVARRRAWKKRWGRRLKFWAGSTHLCLGPRFIFQRNAPAEPQIRAYRQWRAMRIAYVRWCLFVSFRGGVQYPPESDDKS